MKVIGHNKWHHRIPWPQKHTVRHQSHRRKCFSSKVTVPIVVLHNGCQRNAIAYMHLVFKCLKMIFYLSKGRDPCYPVLKFCDNLSIRSRVMAQNIILIGCDLKRWKSSVNVKRFSIRPLPLTHKYTCEVLSKSYCKFFHYGRAIVDWMVARRRRTKEDRTYEKQFDGRWQSGMQTMPLRSDLS